MSLTAHADEHKAALLRESRSADSDIHRQRSRYPSQIVAGNQELILVSSEQAGFGAANAEIQVR